MTKPAQKTPNKSVNARGIKYSALIARCNLLMIQGANSAKESALNQLLILVEQHNLPCFSRSVFDEAPGFPQIFKETIQTHRLQLPKAYLAVFSDFLMETNSQASIALFTTKWHLKTSILN